MTKKDAKQPRVSVGKVVGIHRDEVMRGLGSASGLGPSLFLLDANTDLARQIAAGADEGEEADVVSLAGREMIAVGMPMPSPDSAAERLRLSVAFGAGLDFTNRAPDDAPFMQIILNAWLLVNAYLASSPGSSTLAIMQIAELVSIQERRLARGDCVCPICVGRDAFKLSEIIGLQCMIEGRDKAKNSDGADDGGPVLH